MFKEELIYEDYYTGRPYFRLKQAYFAYVAKEYVVMDREVDKRVFQMMLQEVFNKEYLADICKVLPFYHCVKSARLGFSGDFSGSLAESGIVLIWAVVVVTVSVLVFKKKMRY